MKKPKYALGEVLCSHCRIWIKKEDIASQTYYGEGHHRVLLHKKCHQRIRTHSRHKPHLHERQKERNPYLTYILQSSSKSEILNNLDKWEKLISPRHYVFVHTQNDKQERFSLSTKY